MSFGDLSRLDQADAAEMCPDARITPRVSQLQPEESVPAVLRKMWPERQPEVLDAAAAWLADKFGVVEFADLQGAGAWAEAGLLIVATDGGLSADAKRLLQSLLGRFGAAPAEPPPPAAERREASPAPPKPLSEPHPEDSLPEALQKIWPQRPHEALDSAGKWLTDKFGVAEFADLEGAGAWAEAGLAVVASDTALSADAKRVVQDLLKRFGSAAAPHLAAPGPHTPEPQAAAKDPPVAEGAGRLSDFLVVSRLGRGSFATVHKVVERSSQRQYALKEVSCSKLGELSYREQLQREIAVHLSLDHPHIIRCYESFEDPLGNVHLLLELGVGDLYEHMRRERVLSESEAARVFADVAGGVHYLHLMDVMHRDLKPENVLLDEGRRAKIADLGWCARTSEVQSRECGSPAYFAPEMVAGGGYDGRVDIWALGVLLYEMLVGHTPFWLAVTEAENRRQILKADFEPGSWSSVPTHAQPILRLILRRDPSERPPLLEALAHPWLVSHVGAAASVAAKLAAATALERRREAEAECGASAPDSSTDRNTI